jgi:Flp pilus assembly protein TadB
MLDLPINGLIANRTEIGVSFLHFKSRPFCANDYGNNVETKRKMKGWIVDMASAIALAMLIVFYIFLFLGQIALAVAAFLITCAISLVILLKGRSNRRKQKA